MESADEDSLLLTQKRQISTVPCTSLDEHFASSTVTESRETLTNHSPSAAGQIPSKKHNKMYFPRRFVIVLLCSLSVMISYADRTNISIALMQMQDEMKWSDTTVGLVNSSFFWGYALTQVIGGKPHLQLF
jgi:fucose permease